MKELEQDWVLCGPPIMCSTVFNQSRMPRIAVNGPILFIDRPTRNSTDINAHPGQPLTAFCHSKQVEHATAAPVVQIKHYRTPRLDGIATKHVLFPAGLVCTRGMEPPDRLRALVDHPHSAVPFVVATRIGRGARRHYQNCCNCNAKYKRGSSHFFSKKFNINFTIPK